MPRRANTRLTKTIIDQAAPGTFCWDSGIPGFGLRVTTAGTKSFVFQFRTRCGGQGKITVGGYPAMTVDQARKIARAHRVTVDEGGNPSLDRKVKREAPTLNDLADYYCDVYGPNRPLKADTIKLARSLLGRYALPKFGTRKADTISMGDVRTMQQDARKNSSRFQANKLVRILSKMFNLGPELGCTVNNPCKGIEKDAEPPRSSYMSEDEVGALLRACDGHADQHAADAVRLLLFTGARLREVLNAEWCQFDLKRGIWTKPSSHTKTKRVHRLHVAPEVVRLLSEMRDRGLSDQFLFPGREGSKPRVDLKSPWSRILKRAEIGFFTPHDLRRTTASFMLSTGSDLAVVGKSLGHTQASTTKRYADIFDTVQREGTIRATDSMIRTYVPGRSLSFSADL
jgi:integrase